MTRVLLLETKLELSKAQVRRMSLQDILPHLLLSNYRYGNVIYKLSAFCSNETFGCILGFFL